MIDVNLSPLGSAVAVLRKSARSSPCAEAVEALLPEGDEFVPYLSRFTMLTALSAAIAAFGLPADSAAVVIGAMLVAPLMTPIAAAAATVMARNFRLVRSLAVIALGTLGAVAVGFLTALVVGTTATAAIDLPAEVSARTFPGLLDLGIAITAGAAAGYIIPRRSAIGALPGVGIAVALVPPLATVGICLEVGFFGEAANALLLFLTNLAAIVFAVSVMLVQAGFRPSRSGGSLVTRVAFTMVTVSLVAIPLTMHTRAVVRDVGLHRTITGAVVEWDDSVRVIDMIAGVDGNRAAVDLLVSGPNAPRPAWQLASSIERGFGGPVDLRLQYQRDELFIISVR